MALEAIVFQDGDTQNLVVQTNRGNVGILVDVLSEGGSSSGIDVVEIPAQVGGGGNTFIYFG